MKRVPLYPIERPAVPELAQLMHEFVTGKHPRSVTEAERLIWIAAMDRLLKLLAQEENIALTGLHWDDPKLLEEEPQ